MGFGHEWWDRLGIWGSRVGKIWEWGIQSEKKEKIRNFGIYASRVGKFGDPEGGKLREFWHSERENQEFEKFMHPEWENSGIQKMMGILPFSVAQLGNFGIQSRKMMGILTSRVQKIRDFPIFPKELNPRKT